MASSAAAKKSSWVVAASMAAVEAMKDQAGLCRWNYALRSLHQRVCRPLRSRASRASPASSSAVETAAKLARAKKAEAIMDRAVRFDSWGPH